MRRILASLAITVGILALMLSASAAKDGGRRTANLRRPDARSIQSQRPDKSRFALPAADGRTEPRAVRSSSRSASILDDGQRAPISQRAWSPSSPGILLCETGTTYDFQHNDLADKQIVTIGGDPNTTNVHFTWTHWDVIPESIDQVDRFQEYQGYNPSSGLCLGDCGTTISGAGGDPLRARAGFTDIDIVSDGNATLFVHQRDDNNQDPFSDQTYSSWVEIQGIPCFNLFDVDQLPHSVRGEAIWPHGVVDRNGTAATDVFHVASHPTGEIPAFTNEIHYWRRVGATGTWEGPVVLDINAGPLNHYVTADPSSDKVAVVYVQDHVPGTSPDLLQVAYMESATNGADWIADGAASYPTPLTSLGHSYQAVTSYSDPYGPQSWVEAGGEYDFDGELHVFWVEQAVANLSTDCRLLHWSNSTGFSVIAQAYGWNNAGEEGVRDLWLAYPGLAFGDGQTECTDGPINPGSGGQYSNYDYLYYIYEQYGGETAAEAADASVRGYQNLEVYLSASNDGGNTWSAPVNLTNTQTPGCDGTSGNECASERDASIARMVNDAIHIQYILDTDAGDAVFGQGAWTFNPVYYYKIPGGTDAAHLCPAIAPNFAAHLTDSDPDCEYHATFAPSGVVAEDLAVENLGNAPMSGDISVNYISGSDWLTVVPLGAYTVSAGTNQISSVTMDAGASSIQTAGEGLYQAEIAITHDDTSKASPHVIPIDLFVFNEFYCPEYQVLHTGGTANSLWLRVSNVERFGGLGDPGGGFGRVGVGGDSSWSVYDGSLIIGLPPNPDPLVWRNIYGSGDAQPGFRALGDLVIDTSAYGTNAGAATAYAKQTTMDSTIGVDVDYTFPQNPDSSEFVLIRYVLTNRTGSTIPGASVGAAVDFDVAPGPADASVQASMNTGDNRYSANYGPANTGHLRLDYNLVYQQGVDTAFHTIVGDNTATRFKAGITSIQCGPAPRAWVAPSEEWLFAQPCQGFSDGYLYSEMTKSGFELFSVPSNALFQDQHTVMVFDQDVDIDPAAPRCYVTAIVSSNTGTTEDDIINTTRKAWRYAFGWQVYTEVDTVHINTPKLYPYFALGSHEGGLSSGCCGCSVTKIAGSAYLTVAESEPGGCSGGIRLSEVPLSCDFPMFAVFRVQDLCGDYSDVFTLTLYSYEECQCTCPFQADYDNDGFLTALDLGKMIDVLFAGKSDISDVGCPTVRMDFDNDGFASALDLGKLIDHLFAGGGGPCDPCNPTQSTCAK